MRILIASLSRSGSTKLYYDLRSCLDAEMPCYFEPSPLRLLREPLPAEYLVKLILNDVKAEDLHDLVNLFDKQILLVRDPRDRLISSFLFSLHGVPDQVFADRLEKLEKKSLFPSSVPFLKLVLDIHQEWNLAKLQEYIVGKLEKLKLADDAMSGHLVVKYEDYIRGGIRPIAKQMGLMPLAKLKVPDRHRYGKRISVPGDWKNWLMDSDIRTLRPWMDSFIERYGYDRSWEVNEPRIIDEKFSTAFVSQAHATDRQFKKKGIFWGDG